MGEHVEEFADPVMLLGGVSQWEVKFDAVVVASSLAPCRDVSGVGKIGHDALRCTFGDADSFGDVTDAQVRFGSNRQQHVSVVGEERPGVVRRAGHCHGVII